MKFRAAISVDYVTWQSFTGLYKGKCSQMLEQYMKQMLESTVQPSEQVTKEDVQAQYEDAIGKATALKAQMLQIKNDKKQEQQQQIDNLEQLQNDFNLIIQDSNYRFRLEKNWRLSGAYDSGLTLFEYWKTIIN